MMEFDFDSSALLKAAYDPAKRRMTLTFKGSGSYDYDNVPQELYDQLCDCDSAGGFYSQHIRGKYPSADGRKLDVQLTDAQTGLVDLSEHFTDVQKGQGPDKDGNYPFVSATEARNRR